ncbi:hypothetical protein Neosp_009973 [[Neocosmospora] mangrovei]
MKTRFTRMATSAAAIAIGMALYEVFPVAHAMPTTRADLHARNAASADFEDIYLSKVTANIFGQDATHYDFSVIDSEKALAIAAVHDYAAAFAEGNENKILVTFVNATMAGHLKVGQAEDTAWLCGELDEVMLPHVSQCAHIEKRDILEARSRWNWTKSTSHVASTFGAQVLAGYLGNLAWSVFPVSPRSVCSSGACLSWAQPLAGFTGYFAQQLVQDALSAADLNHYSVEAYRGVNNIDICISNRASGCT